jgi:hypothetical protein
MSESDDGKETEEITRYHHEFTKEELEQLMYQWDERADPVHEYHYMKLEWQTEDAIIGEKKKDWKPPKALKPKKNLDPNELKKGAKDTGERTEVDLNKDAPEDEELVFLNLDTNAAVHVVEFYSVRALCWMKLFSSYFTRPN